VELVLIYSTNSGISFNLFKEQWNWSCRLPLDIGKRALFQTKVVQIQQVLQATEIAFSTWATVELTFNPADSRARPERDPDLGETWWRMASVSVRSESKKKRDKHKHSIISRNTSLGLIVATKTSRATVRGGDDGFISSSKITKLALGDHPIVEGPVRWCPVVPRPSACPRRH
jgi:hypothetical protein